MLNPNDISTLFDTSPSLKLLVSQNRSQIISFFLSVFDIENPNPVSGDNILVGLADFPEEKSYYLLVT